MARAANSDTIMVTINVTDVNEAPDVTGEAAVTFQEVDDAIDAALGTYAALDDPDVGDNSVTWSVSGSDAGKFTIDRWRTRVQGEARLRESGDANSDNVYEVTVVAADSNGNRGTMDVKVTVENQEEGGVVTLSRTQPRVGVAVRASLTDPDGSISGLTWQWSDANADIAGANSDTYTPTDDDATNVVRLRATASYTDGEGSDKSAAPSSDALAVEVDTRNQPPAFEDQDTETDGVQNESTERKVEENTKALAGDADDDADTDTDAPADNVGSEVMAMDPDPNTDPLIYTLSGDDAGLFRVRNNGQIEVAAGTELDYEMKDTYMVTLMAEDSFGASATIMVTIMVTDMDEMPEVTGDATAEYAENGTGAVETYTAVDPELTDIVSWSLDGTDAGVFDISAGVLTFKKSPNYEMAMGTGNIYEVTVQATDETNKVGMKKVMVEVTNAEEPGMVTLSALRPQSATAFTASLTDPDGGMTGTTWQWSKASSRNGSYTDIENATLTIYTPGDADISSYLRATASYTDGEGSGKSATERSVYSVQRRPGSNSAPEFADDQDPVTNGDQVTATREVPENTPAGMAIGDPVVAEDGDSDILTYTLTGDDAESFDIDWATGQIITKAPLDFEDNTNMSYTVTVRATDPSGVPAGSAVPANSGEVTVNINVTDVNEAPAVTGNAAVTFEEVAHNIATPLATYMEDDPDGVDADTQSTWSVTGADAGKFEIDTIDTNGVLTFKAKPDFEAQGDANRDNVYEVTVVAADSNGNRGTMDVKVTVENEEEGGVVTLSRTQPRVGLSVKASLTDPDGSISGLTWQWSDANADIAGANSDTYTPVARRRWRDSGRRRATPTVRVMK